MATNNIKLLGILSASDQLYAVIDDQEGELYAVLAENSGEEE